MRNVARVMALAVGLSVVSASVYAVPAHANDTVIDSVGDWMATFGKKDLDKQAILAQRKTQREAARAQKAAQRQAKKAGKELDKAGKDLKKGLGGLSN